MAKKDAGSQFIYCPVCSGTGKKKSGLICPNCNGAGLGIFHQGRFFYWGHKISRAIIELDEIRKKLNIALNLAAYGAGLAGLAALGAWIYRAGANTQELGAFAFWREQHILILVFWVSIIAFMFIFYRMSEEERRKHKIKQLSYEEKNKEHDLPNNWDELKEFKGSHKIDVARGFSPEASAIVDQAYLLALRLGQSEAAPLHLFFCSLAAKEAAAIFSRLNVDSVKLAEKLKGQIARLEKSEQKPRLSGALKEVLIKAYIEAGNFGQKKVTVKNFSVHFILLN